MTTNPSSRQPQDAGVSPPATGPAPSGLSRSSASQAKPLVPNATNAARSALFSVELARVKHHQPSGGYDYFTVEFAGARIVFKAPFHDEGVDCIRGPLGPEMAALSDKAARCATGINNLLFNLATRAAEIALVGDPQRPVCTECGGSGYENHYASAEPASAGEAQRAETTKIGSVHEHAVGAAETPKGHSR